MSSPDGKSQLKAKWGEMCLSSLGSSLFSLSLFEVLMGALILNSKPSSRVTL